MIAALVLGAAVVYCLRQLSDPRLAKTGRQAKKY